MMHGPEACLGFEASEQYLSGLYLYLVVYRFQLSKMLSTGRLVAGLGLAGGGQSGV